MRSHLQGPILHEDIAFLNSTCTSSSAGATMDGRRPDAIEEFSDSGSIVNVSNEKFGVISPEFELDSVHDGLEFPTQEERVTLRRVPDSIPWNAYRTSYSFPLLRSFSTNLSSVIAIVELAERFSVCFAYFVLHAS